MRNLNSLTCILTFTLAFSLSFDASAGIDISYSFVNENQFTAEQRTQIIAGFNEAATLWENVITGRGGNLELFELPISIQADESGLAAASPRDLVVINGNLMPNAGMMWINPDQVADIVVGFGLTDEPTNFMDELLAHEIGHSLGFGSLWDDSYYVPRSGEYRGEFGLAAYQEEFDSEADFIPVELAGGNGSANSHWNQLFRSSAQEGNPEDPLSLSPLVGITDGRSRDLAQDLMSPALDPDYGEPFLSNTTVQALRDLGYDVISSFPIAGDMDENGLVNSQDADFLNAMIRATSSDPYFDLTDDATLDSSDHVAWIQLVGTVPGDANFDLHFDSTDLIDVFQVAEYEDDLPMNSTWAEGDWNGDTEFDSGDMIFAFQYGAFESDGDNLNVVPEPTRLPIVALLTLFSFCRHRRLDGWLRTCDGRWHR